MISSRSCSRAFWKAVFWVGCKGSSSRRCCVYSGRKYLASYAYHRGHCGKLSPDIQRFYQLCLDHRSYIPKVHSLKIAFLFSHYWLHVVPIFSLQESGKLVIRSKMASVIMPIQKSWLIIFFYTLYPLGGQGRLCILHDIMTIFWYIMRFWFRDGDNRYDYPCLCCFYLFIYLFFISVGWLVSCFAQLRGLLLISSMLWIPLMKMMVSNQQDHWNFTTLRCASAPTMSCSLALTLY